MKQLELPFDCDFMVYDIYSDSYRTMNRKDVEVYEAVYYAYARVRRVVNEVQGYGPLLAALDRVHSDLKQKVVSH
jgi:hypothetical protein